MDVVAATLDPQLFADTFGAATWDPWRTCLRAVFALPPEPGDLELFTRCTGRERWPMQPARQLWALIGRRGGKSRAASLLAVWLACSKSYALAPGERGTVLVVAADRAQGGVCLSYIRALLAHPMLAPMVVAERAESIDLANNLTIAIATCSYRTIRGRTVVACVCDEVCFWRSEESAEPDLEVVNAILPAMSTVPGALLVGISTPYSRRGAAWRAYSRHWGKDSDVLVWNAPSLVMNPGLAPEVIEAARAEDPSAAASEWDALWRRDIEGYSSREAVEACVVEGRRELPPLPEVRYFGFADPSGGAHDSFALAVAHREGEVAILDCVRERRPPFSPDEVVAEYAEVLRRYRLSTVAADKYAAAWPVERWAKHGIRCVPSERTASELFRELLGPLNSGQVELLDVPRLVGQLCSLERRTSRGGRELISHPPNGHDDVAVVVAGALRLALARRPGRGPADLYGPGKLLERLDHALEVVP